MDATQGMERIEITVATHTHEGKAVALGDRIDVPAPIAQWMVEQGVGVRVAAAGSASKTKT